MLAPAARLGRQFLPQPLGAVVHGEETGPTMFGAADREGSCAASGDGAAAGAAGCAASSAEGGVSSWPHSRQKRAPSTAGALHDGHSALRVGWATEASAAPTGAPHSRQKRDSAETSCPQWLQRLCATRAA